MRPRVTKIICPSCEGTGKGLLGGCMWCKGELRLSAYDALRYADMAETVSYGQFVCDGGSYKDREADKKKIARIYDLLRVEKPQC